MKDDSQAYTTLFSQAGEPRADVRVLHRSPVGRVVDYRCRARGENLSEAEVTEWPAVSFVRRGEFEYRVGARRLALCEGLVLLEAPGFEHRVRHAHGVPDECTSVELAPSLLEEAGERAGAGASAWRRGALALPSRGRLDYLHAKVRQWARGAAPALRVEAAMVSLFLETWRGDARLADFQPPARRERDRHAESVARAKAFVHENFRRDLSLDEIARSAYVSAFHFSRLFKRLTSQSPYQYLVDVRLAHAALLLRDTTLSVTEVWLESGFNTLEHFIATFTRRYGASPSRYRRRPPTARGA